MLGDQFCINITGFPRLSSKSFNSFETVLSIPDLIFHVTDFSFPLDFIYLGSKTVTPGIQLVSCNPAGLSPDIKVSNHNVKFN